MGERGVVKRDPESGWYVAVWDDMVIGHSPDADVAQAILDAMAEGALDDE